MYIKVHVEPGAKRESIKQLAKDNFALTVKEKAERNQANNRVLDVLSAFLMVPRGKLRIVVGHHSPSKIIDVLD